MHPADDNGTVFSTGSRRMTSDLDIYRTALVLVRQHGANAALHASMRHDELLGARDVEGSAVWKRVLAAIDTLSAEKRPDGASLQ